MKKLLKTILKKEWWEKLQNLKKKISSIFKRLAVVIIELFPERLLLIVKSDVEIRKKLDYPHHDIFLCIESRVERNRRNSCKKEPELIEWIHTFLKEGDVFYDIGANIGAYSLVASKFLRGRTKVYAFEPGFANFSQLCKNIFINRCQESIVPFQIALSDRTTIAVFNYSDILPGSALHTLGDATDQRGNHFEPIFRQKVLSYRMDDFIGQFKLLPPNHVKLDVDGGEFMVLVGAGETLQNPGLKSIIMELDEEAREMTKKIIDFLSLKGLAFYSKHRLKDIDGKESPESFQMYNYIFKRE